MFNELENLMLNAAGVHWNAVDYLSQQAAQLEEDASTVIKKPKYIDAEELSNSASCSLAAIICAYAKIESQINVFIDWCHGSSAAKYNYFDEIQLVCIRKATTVPGFERIETLKKYQEILRMADKGEFEIDKEPYQSADLLRRLRNFMVHLKSRDSKTFVDEATKLKRALESRKIAFHLSRSSQYPDAFLTSECASWAGFTASKFVDSFIQKIDNGD
jgi:hypothetical protein